MHSHAMFALLCAASLSADAEPPGSDWQLLSNPNAKADIYYDTTSTVVEYEYRSVMLLANMKVPVKGLGARPSMVARYEFDCKLGRMRIQFAKMFAEHNGTGKSGESQNRPTPWEPVEVSGMFRDLYKSMCAKQPP